MDYLKEAARLLRVASSGGSEDDTGPSAEQIVATRAVASALVAITEHLAAFGTGVAMRREIDKLAIGFDEIESKLAGIVVQHVNDFAGIDREIETVKRQQTASLDAAAALEDRFGDAFEISAQVALAAAETAKLQNERLNEIERRLKKVESEDVELGRYVKNVLEGRFANIERKLPDAPRVGAWQTCGACDGKGIDPDSDEEERCPVCEGRGMVEVYGRSEGGSGKWYRCKACDGSGWRGIDTETTQCCDICGGSGRVHVPVETQPALADHPDYRKTVDAIMEDANADIERHQRQLALRDKQIDEAQLYARSVDQKLNNVLHIIQEDMPLDKMKRAIEDATR